MTRFAVPRRKQTLLLLAFLAVYTVWGSTYLAIRFAIETIPPFLMAGTRFFIAGLILYAIAWAQGARTVGIREWKTAAIMGACLLLGGNGGVTIAEKYVSSGLASVMVATVPIYIALLGWAMKLVPRPRAIVWAGLAGGLAGVAILVGPALTVHGGTAGRTETGMLILLVSSFLWSAGSLYSRVRKGAASPLLATAQQMLCGGTALMIVGGALGEIPRLRLHEMSYLSLGAFAYLIFVGAIIGYTAYTWLLRNCEPAKVATYAYVNPVVAVLLGAAFAGETLSGRSLFAAALIIGSVALVITIEQSSARTITPAVVGCQDTA